MAAAIMHTEMRQCALSHFYGIDFKLKRWRTQLRRRNAAGDGVSRSLGRSGAGVGLQPSKV